MMEHEEAEETDGHSSGQRGLQAQVMIRLVFSMFQVIQTDGIFQV